MRPNLLAALAATALIAACVDAPSGVAPPELIPVAGLLAAGDALGANPPQAADVALRADVLAARAAALAGPAPGGEAARAAALAARAAALRGPVLSEAERARLAGGVPPLPPPAASLQ